MKLLFIDGTAGFSPHRIEEKPTGGIITSLTLVPRLLTKDFGHECIVASHYEVEEVYDSVKYVRLSSIPDIQPDVVIYNRNLINNKMLEHFNCPSIWWLHDICQFTYLDDNCFKHVDKIVALSDYCKRSYADFYDIHSNKFEIIPNGVDKKIFYPGTALRNRNLFVMASAPIKGLSAIPFIFEQLKRHNPNLELRLYSSQSLHDKENDEQTSALLRHLQGLGVSVKEPISQPELADVFRNAYALLMPNTYPENCSNTLLQARACGLPVIASAIGSVPEFIFHGENGLLTHTAPHDLFWFWKDLATLSVKLYLDENLQQRLSMNTSRGIQGWRSIATEWDNLIASLAKEKAA